MRSTYITLFFLCFVFAANGQTNVSFLVGGDFDRFYPVLFNDANWHNNKATEIEIGRSDIHTNSDWRGSMISSFRYHTTVWGNGSNFIDASIRASTHANSHALNFIAGWHDATGNNGNLVIIIWLRGGNTTYYLNGASTINPIVYDGVQNALPYHETNGPDHNVKTQLDEYVANFTAVSSGSAFFLGGSNNYFNGNVGVGTFTPQEKLSVNGNIRAKEIKVETTNWPDYVFKPEYQLPSLAEIEKQIKIHGHLSGIPSAKEAEANGVALGEMNKQLLKKVEELTLHLIEKEKELKMQEKKIIDLRRDVDALKMTDDHK